MPGATQGAKYSLEELKLPRAAWVSLGPNPFFLMPATPQPWTATNDKRWDKEKEQWKYASERISSHNNRKAWDMTRLEPQVRFQKTFFLSSNDYFKLQVH